MGKARPAKKGRRFRFLSRLLLIVVSLIIGVNVYLWNAQSLVGNQLPMPFGFGMAVVLSGSMEPTLYANDLVLIRETQDIQVGDVIVFQSGENLVIHRVVFMEGETIQTQGDANNVADDPITLSDVKGRMIARIPGAGKAVQALKSPPVILAICAAAFILMESSFRGERRSDDAELEEIKEEIRRLKSE